jgi:hypothetical protein
MSKLPLGRLLLLGIVIALGLALAWGSALGFGMALVEQSRMRQGVVDHLYFTQTGEPVIYRQSLGEFGQTTLLDLQGGALVGVEYNELILPRYSSLGSGPSRWIGVPWRERIAADTDNRAPRAAWYLIHDGQANGRAYGVGYDLQSNRRVGYCNRSRPGEE